MKMKRIEIKTMNRIIVPPEKRTVTKRINCFMKRTNLWANSKNVWPVLSQMSPLSLKLIRSLNRWSKTDKTK